MSFHVTSETKISSYTSAGFCHAGRPRGAVPGDSSAKSKASLWGRQSCFCLWLWSSLTALLSFSFCPLNPIHLKPGDSFLECTLLKSYSEPGSSCFFLGFVQVPENRKQSGRNAKHQSACSHVLWFVRTPSLRSRVGPKVQWANQLLQGGPPPLVSYCVLGCICFHLVGYSLFISWCILQENVS